MSCFFSESAQGPQANSQGSQDSAREPPGNRRGFPQTSWEPLPNRQLFSDSAEVPVHRTMKALQTVLGNRQLIVKVSRVCT